MRSPAADPPSPAPGRSGVDRADLLRLLRRTTADVTGHPRESRARRAPVPPSTSRSGSGSECSAGTPQSGETRVRLLVGIVRVNGLTLMLSVSYVAH